MSNIEEIEFLKGRVAAQKLEIERLKEKNTHDQFAGTLKSVFDSLMAAGFTEEKAWRLLLLTVKATFKVEE